MKLTPEWYQKELGRWKIGDWCHECDYPQWIGPEGEHLCADIPWLQSIRAHHERQIFKFKSALRQVDHYLNILSTQKDISDKEVAFNLARDVVWEALNEPHGGA